MYHSNRRNLASRHVLTGTDCPTRRDVALKRSPVCITESERVARRNLRGHRAVSLSFSANGQFLGVAGEKNQEQRAALSAIYARGALPLFVLFLTNGGRLGWRQAAHVGRDHGRRQRGRRWYACSGTHGVLPTTARPLCGETVSSLSLDNWLAGH
ncbi:hypothetical protein MRX96_026503 [Rhipicephalus microplus]